MGAADDLSNRRAADDLAGRRATDDLSMRKRFLDQVIASRQEAPLPTVDAPPLESDTASGDLRIAIVKFSERQREDRKVLDQIRADQVLFRRAMVELRDALNAVSSTDRVLTRRVDGVEVELEAHSRDIQSWKLARHDENVSRKVVMRIIGIVGAGGTVLGFVIEHWHILQRLVG
jgi:hypothetical protein